MFGQLVLLFQKGVKSFVHDGRLTQKVLQAMVVLNNAKDFAQVSPLWPPSCAGHVPAPPESLLQHIVM